uniref:Uncharacterized protein n=1 Tax=Tanacetum cinerariifolium TaxID=118510 RepID=A0A6L2L533_TANCI|nr:hypothetical protein [Tanacetum cinerariifolium]
MANTGTPLIQELARAADYDDIMDQLVVLFSREVAEDTEKMENYRQLSGQLRNGLDDMEKASCLLLMAREIQSKVFEKNTFIASYSKKNTVQKVEMERYMSKLDTVFFRYCQALVALIPAGCRKRNGNSEVEMLLLEGVTPSVVNMTVEMGKHKSLEDTNVPESFPPLSTAVNTAGNAFDKSSYANKNSKPSGKKVNVCTLFTPEGNGIDVVVLVDSIRAISA